jgi:hypothetical protein
LCDELCSFGVWNADGICYSGLDVQTTPRRLGGFLKRGQWFSKAEADMRNRGVQAMFCPCIEKSFFIIWSHVVSQKITRVGINMVRKALMNSKQAA